MSGTNESGPSIDLERLRAAVDRRWDEQVAFLQEIVRIPSVTGNEEAVQRAIAARMSSLGFATDVWEPDVAALAPYAGDVGAFTSFSGRPNVVGTLEGGGDGRSLILNAHIDVVDAGDPVRWTHPPYAAEIADGRLFGRGSCDMKAGLTANIYAVTALREAGYRPRGRILVESVISEEDGGAGTLACVLRGYRADGAIITEPTRLAVMAAQGGSLVFRLHVPGLSAHGCVRDEGVSAIENFAYLHRALLDFEARRNATLDHPLYASIANKIPISIGVIHGGLWPSSVAESVAAEGRAGLVPGEDLDAFRAEFIGVVDTAADRDPWLRDHRPTVEWFSGQFAPAEIAVDHPLVAAMREAHAAVTGSTPPVEGATYGADMRHFLLFGNTPCVMYGAGDVRLAHFTDESIDLAELKTATLAVAYAAGSWCGVDADVPSR